MKTQTVQRFINWWDYEHNMSEIYFDWKLDDFKKSTRIFDNAMGILLGELAKELNYKFTTYGRFMTFINKHKDTK